MCRIVRYSCVRTVCPSADRRLCAVCIRDVETNCGLVKVSLYHNNAEKDVLEIEGVKGTLWNTTEDDADPSTVSNEVKITADSFKEAELSSKWYEITYKAEESSGRVYRSSFHRLRLREVFRQRLPRL